MHAVKILVPNDARRMHAVEITCLCAPLDVATAVDTHAWPLEPTEMRNFEIQEKTLPSLNQTGKGFS